MHTNTLATKMNNIVRCFTARARVRKRKKLLWKNRLEKARGWKEMWSEDEQKWFYLSQTTGEALWEPPKDGYTKNDGTLVLETGMVVDDPNNAATVSSLLHMCLKLRFSSFLSLFLPANTADLPRLTSRPWTT